MSFPTASPEMVRWCSLLVALFCTATALFSIVGVLKANHTGTALYRPNPRSSAGIPVTRVENPKEFKEAVNLLGFNFVASGTIALVTFGLFRRLS